MIPTFASTSILLSLVLSLSPHAARAQSIEDMLPFCRQSYSYCEAFIEGAAFIMQGNCQMTMFGNNGLHTPKIGWFPSSSAGRQAFLNWAEANPGLWAEPFKNGVIGSLEAAFPCSD